MSKVVDNSVLKAWSLSLSPQLMRWKRLLWFEAHGSPKGFLPRGRSWLTRLTPLEPKPKGWLRFKTHLLPTRKNDRFLKTAFFEFFYDCFLALWKLLTEIAWLVCDFLCFVKWGGIGLKVVYCLGFLCFVFYGCLFPLTPCESLQPLGAQSLWGRGVWVSTSLI